MNNNQYSPEIIEKTEDEIKEVFDTINRCPTIPDEMKILIIRCIKNAISFALWLQKKNITIRRLRTMLFGEGYGRGKKRNTTGEADKKDSGQNSTLSEATAPNVTENTVDPSSHASGTLPESTEPVVDEDNKKEKKPGHGRMSHTVYQNCEEIDLNLSGLALGDDCPLLCGGKLGAYDSGVIIRIKGQNFVKLLRYTLEKLRCSLCGEIFVAKIPPEVANEEKYDAAFKAMLALMKYYVAVPFYRQEYFQKLLNFPLSDSTQWDLIEQLAGSCYPVFNALKTVAANGKLIQNDDTSLKILEVIKQIKEGTAGNRTGMYTTGIIAEQEGHKIALFINGRKHSGENLEDILKQRLPELPPILQMCDALNANIPSTMQTILCNCLSHGFRKFAELVDYFPEACLPIMHLLGQVYQHDADTQGMSDQKRLEYHQEHSAPVMEALAQHMCSLWEERRVEPNSELGKAIKYMQKHWKKLTRFLTVAGAPIDNNIVERALKIAIRNRKAAMFYRTNYSAQIGGMITSLIYTCHLESINPLDYLTALQQHKAEVTAAPNTWLPWNYLDTMKEASAANEQAHAPPAEYPAAA